MALSRKILFYTHGLTGGGAERVWALLASGFYTRGYEVVFAVDYESNENADLLDPAIRLIVLGGGHFSTTMRLAHLIAAEQPDVTLSAIGVSNLKHVIAAIATRTWKRAAISYHAYHECEPQLLSRFGYYLTPFSSRLCARTICVSDCLLSYVLTKWWADPRKTIRIYNPVSTEAANPALSALELKARSPVVLAGGRLVPNKNFIGLVRAFALVEPRNARLLIMGEGPERKEIEAEAKRLGLSDRVLLLGYVREPWHLYQQASCFAVSSRSESFAMVVIEALAHGLPVVSTDCNGPRELLDNGKYGALVPYDDATAMADALTRALAEPGEPRDRIERSKQFSVQIGVDNYEKVVDAICAAHDLKPILPVSVGEKLHEG